MKRPKKNKRRIPNPAAPKKATALRRRVVEWNTEVQSKYYSALFDGGSQGILVAGIKPDCFLYANRSICRMLGYSKKELLKLGLNHIHPAEALARVKAAFVALTRGKKILAEEIPCRRKDGTIFYADITALTLPTNGQKHIAGFFTDVTDRMKAEQALQESEEKFRSVADLSPNMIFINCKGRIVYVNTKCEEIMGYTRKQFCSPDFNFLVLIAPEYIKAIQNAFRKHQNGKEVPPYEYAVVTKQGKRIETIITTKLINYGGETAILGIITDITERKQAEATLQRSMQQLTLLLQTVPAAIYRAKASGDFGATFVSENVTEMTGYVPGEFVKESSFWSHHIHPDDRARVFAELPRMFKLGHHVHEYRFRHKAGHYIWMHDELRLICNAGGNPIEIIGCWMDITERKRMEETLRESEERFRRVFEEGPLSMGMASLTDGRILCVNKAFCQMLGYTEKEFKRLAFTDITHPGHRAQDMEVIKRMRQGQIQKHYTEKKYLKKNGEVIWGARSLAKIRSSDGKSFYVLSMITDITERKRMEEALKQSISLLQATLESTADGILVVDNQGKIAGFNKRFIQLWHIPKKIIASHNDQRALAFVLDQLKDPKGFLAKVHKLYAQPKVESFDTLEFKDGRVFERYSHPQQIEGQPAGRVWSFRDVTKRKQAEESLQESREHYRLLFEGITDGVFVHEITDDNLPGQFIAVNDTICQWLGYTRKELLRLTVRDIDAPESNVNPQTITKRLKRDKKALFEQIHVAKDGRRIPVEINAQMFQMQGHLVVISVIRDITERKMAEEAKRKHTERITRLSFLKHQLLGTTSISEKLKLITDEVVEILGTGSARIWLTKEGDLCEKGCHHAAVVEGVNVCRNRSQCLHLVASSGRYTNIDGSHQRVPFGVYKIGRIASGGNEKFITNDAANDLSVCDHQWVNSLGLVSFAGYRLMSSDGMPIGVLALFGKQAILPDEEPFLEDLANTASKVVLAAMVEEERHKLELQVQQTQKLESIGILTSGIAHDFNNLLTVILGHVNLALTSLASESPAKDNLGEIERASRTAAELCQQMLAYSGSGKFIRETINLSHLVQELAQLLQISIPKKTMLHCHFADNLPAIEADPAQIRQVVMNLIINASEAIDENEGVITLSTNSMTCDKKYLRDGYAVQSPSSGLYVYLEVSDTGCGMDAKTMAKIFDPFFSTKFTGRGLGLAAILGIVRQHKGVIKINSEPGKGTTFRVLFPASSKTILATAPETLQESTGGE